MKKIDFYICQQKPVYMNKNLKMEYKDAKSEQQTAKQGSKYTNDRCLYQKYCAQECNPHQG
ncbi:hypothetical protein KSZ_44180 [Dictyobacter formicarum]|uniref:Uncharacterized protein n=1 Tax=Dictyobacter formicarum TaxID=2778368 RepID=A0ABQ3VJM2_9CHLR|nr:hypothetical protein KSZ_44180 [Dictyobacter formicarum]